MCLLLSPRLLNCSSLQEIRPLLAKPGHTSHWWRRRRLTMTLSSTSSLLLAWQLLAKHLVTAPMFMRPPKSTSGHTLSNMVIVSYLTLNIMQKRTMSESFQSFSSLSLWPYFLLLWFVPAIGYRQSRHSHVFCTLRQKTSSSTIRQGPRLTLKTSISKWVEEPD